MTYINNQINSIYLVLVLIIGIFLICYMLNTVNTANTSNTSNTSDIKVSNNLNNKLYENYDNINLNDKIVFHIDSNNYHKVISSLLDKFKDPNTSDHYNQSLYSNQSRQFLDDYMKTKLISKKSNIDKYQMNTKYFPKNSVIVIDNNNFTEIETNQLLNTLDKTTCSDSILVLSKLPKNIEL